jgi:hypothetical protein
MRVPSLTLGLLLFLAACTVTREDYIAGTYLLTAPCVTAALVLKLDHSFLQTVRTNSGETNRLTGVWSVSRGGFVYIRPILSLRDASRGQKIGGLASKVEWSMDGRRIGPEIVQCADSAYEVDYFQSR